MIRKAKLSDSADLTRLAAVLGYSTSQDDLIDQLNYILSDERQIVLVFEHENKVVGYLQAALYTNLYAHGKYFNVMGLVVDEEMHHQGIAKKLISEIEKMARERNYQGVRLNSGEERKGAHIFYEKQGFATIKSQKLFKKQFD